MELTNYRTALSGDKEIAFPKLECWNNSSQMATVAVNVNKKRVLCRISLESLIDKFGSSDEEPMCVVTRHRSAIQEAAIRLIENKTYEKDGSVLIRTRDLL
ncbi:MAG: DUF1488 family protein [Methylococcales bacterium]|jgi:Protein of unknown function (DUF1488)